MPANPTIRLQDYRPPAYRVLQYELEFCLHETETIVYARTSMQRVQATPAPLPLDGREFACTRLAIDGRELAAEEFAKLPGGIVIHAPPAAFTLEVTTRLDPAGNTALEGLYMSGGRYCTQCEAEGFRTITYALDRPDVMARYKVRIEANRASCPTLLSNGNRTAAGDLPNNRHFAVFDDPHPKPTYLFALAAGAYESLHDTFVTRAGRRVQIGIHVDPGEGSRAHYALDSLRRAMRWDEQRYEREYDLDEFHLVAVRDFNFGAMENKGLNIFNSAYVLADPQSATDGDYEGIEAVVGHEYFHNWTGNRITCRDWFQLSLKEGLTVFREHQFSADMRSAAVQRIKDTKRLRLRQFAEDQGPLAHPVRPHSYQAIDNFYTATVYEKGAEVIRMLQSVIGEGAFARGMQLYFARRDGTASTVEDLVACFAEASGRDLSPFFGWYDQAGTPHLRVRSSYDAAARRCTLVCEQHTPPTPGQPDKKPLPIPLRIGFLSPAGEVLRSRRTPAADADAEHAVLFATAKATLVFDGLVVAAGQTPVPAVLRGFSAPVVLDDGLPVPQRLVQMAHDPDPFTRWDAGQMLAAECVLGTSPDPAGLRRDLAAALGKELDRAAADPAFAALALRVPELSELVQLAATPDPERLFAARELLRQTIATTLRDRLTAIVQAPRAGEFSLSAHAAGERALRAAAMDLLASLGVGEEPLLWTAFAGADSMTDSIAALDALGTCGGTRFDAALAIFHDRWHDRPLVIDKWFAVQALAPRADALARVRRLREHPEFELRNPNRVRALAKAFAGNLCAFHAADGSGYEFVARITAAVDDKNPALASRLLQPFETWRRFDAGRQAHARRVLEQLLLLPGLSKNLREMLERTLA